MSRTSSNLSTLKKELEKLMEPGLLGFYSHFEVTEIFMIEVSKSKLEEKKAFNIFTILVAENRSEVPLQEPVYLSKERIITKKLKNFFFGIMRYSLPISTAIDVVDTLAETSMWQLSGDSLSFGKLSAIPIKFVPPDTMESIPLNKVLKNNFWNGSYVFEWIDPNKSALQVFYNEPTLLQEISPLFQKYVPINLASLSDRLGNLIIQLPVTILMYGMKRSPDRGSVQIDLAWHPKAEPRTLRANFDMEFDGCVSGYSSSIIQAPLQLLPIQSFKGTFRHVIWDEQNQIILAASAPNYFLDSLSIGGHIGNPEPRVFKVRQKDGGFKNFRISLTEQFTKSVVGKHKYDDNYEPTQKRMYTEEVERLTAQRKFIQYRPKVGQKQLAHEEALEDLRRLINTYGLKGAWLWDPYLSAEDILNTLFHCEYYGADLRAITSPKTPLVNSNAEHISFGLYRKLISWLRQWYYQGSFPIISYKDQQKQVFQDSQCNWQGVNFEYRIKSGNNGWDFHDRFIIFPDTVEGTLAWSLGTSVNSFGKKHHILQRVDNGQIVMDAFLELWSQLDKPENIIWKKKV